jgi:hypothetical protein
MPPRAVTIERMSAVLVLLMVVVLLAFALGVVVLVAMLLRKESDKVRAARGAMHEDTPVADPDPSVEQRAKRASVDDPSVEQRAKRASVETTGGEPEATQPVPTVDKRD